MRKVFLNIFFLFSWLSLFAVPLVAIAQPSSNKNLLQQQMILMGLYIYGINHELAQKIPDTNEMQFLAESILDIAAQARKIQGDALYHKNIDDLLAGAQKLKTASMKNDLALAQNHAKDLINACAKCHSHKN